MKKDSETHCSTGHTTRSSKRIQNADTFDTVGDTHLQERAWGVCVRNSVCTTMRIFCSTVHQNTYDILASACHKLRTSTSARCVPPPVICGNVRA